MRKYIGLLLVTTAGLICAACAPGDRPTEPAPTAPAATDTTPREVLHVPRPVQYSSGLAGRIESAVSHVRRRDLLTTNGFWTIFHGILGLGPSLTLRNPDSGERVNALDYICAGGEMRGLRFFPTRHGLDVQMGPLMVGQGHQDQFIAEMAQWNMPADRKVVVFGKEYTFLDFVRHAQMQARTTANQELSWAVVAVGQYLGTDITWTNAHGEKLHFEDLVRYELSASVEQAACGGTHRLFGLTWAYHLHLQNGGRTEGVWQEVAAKTAKYRDLARKYQNADGCFSTDFFRGPGNATDKQLRVNTTGHTLEWLALALPDEELREPWVQSAANALALTILELQDAPIEGGPLYHAVHGLLLYYARLYDRQALGANDPFFPPPPR